MIKAVHSRRHVLAFGAGFALLVAGPPAAAQGADSPTAATTPAGDAAGTAWYQRERLTGDWNGSRTTLAGRGIVPYATWTAQVTGNLHGGLRTLTDADGVVEFGADFDLEDLGVWKGATLHVSGLWVQDGDDPSADYIGNFDEVNNLAALKSIRFFQAYVRKDFQNGKVSTKIGQLALDDDFMVSLHAQLFVNASFGSLPVESANTQAPAYPLGAPGAWARMTVTRTARVQIGVYDGDAGTQAGNRNGLRVSVGPDQGAMIIAEGGMDATPGGLPGTYKLGAYLNTGRFTDYATGQARSGIHAVYGVLDQALDVSGDGRSLGIFLRGGLAQPPDRTQVDWYVDGGITGRGLRGGDQAGLGISHASFSEAFVAARSAEGTPVRNAETVIELSYQAAVMPWLKIQPDLQYVIHPQNAAARNAWVAALRFQISL